VLIANLVRKYGRTAIPSVAEFIKKLIDMGVSTIILNRHPAKGNTIMGDDLEILHGTGYIREKLGTIEYQLSAPSFFQVNPVQAAVLYQQAINQAQLNGTETVIDAHAGVGGVALFAAKQAKHVLGIDIVQPAISDAQKNAELNSITNAEFLCGAAEEILPKILEENSKPDVVFLDPPRKGCDIALLNALNAAQIPKIIYISCDPATLARDVKILASGGYQLTEVQPVDLFPHTGKVEVCCKLEKNMI
jgi:23S rRNA (uracil1939-C5)-methyltransferase